MKLHHHITIIGLALFPLLGQPAFSQSESNSTEENYKRTVLPPSVNTPYVEVRPLISPDGQTLYFGRREHPDNIKKEKDLQDIYVTNREAKGWSKARNLGETVNNKFANSICSVSPDGQQILVMNTYSKIKGPLVTFSKNGNEWDGPYAVEIDRYYNNSEYIDFYMDFERDVLFMAVEREDGRGEQDLYVSFKQENGVWSQPVNMGANVNSNKADFAPFLGSDGRTLFFCSYGLNGLGGSDIYYSHRLDDSWTNWSIPVNMGKPVNTSGEETYVSATIDLKTLYFVSYRHGSEKRDILSLPLKEEVLDLPPLEAAPIAVAIKETILTPNQPQKLSEVKKVQEESKNQQAILSMVDTVGKPETTNESDKILVVNNDTDDLEVIQSEEITSENDNKPEEAINNDATLSIAGAIANTSEIAARTTSTSGEVYKLKSANPEIAKVDLPINVPARVINVVGKPTIDLLRNVYFNFNQSKLRANQSQQYLQDVAAILKQNPDVRIKITGHADEMGTHKANLVVSKNRALTIKRFLQQQGIDASRLVIDYKGETEPLASNDDDREGRELNRRVGFQVML